MRKQKKRDDFAEFMKEFKKLSVLKKKMLVLLAETVFDWETFLGLWIVPRDKNFAPLFEQYSFEEVAAAAVEFVHKELKVTDPNGPDTVYWFLQAITFTPNQRLMLEMSPELKPLMLQLKELKLDPNAL